MLMDCRIKTKTGTINLTPGQLVKMPEDVAKKLILSGKVKPVDEFTQLFGETVIAINRKYQPDTLEHTKRNKAEVESLKERTAIMGENCNPDETLPYVKNDVLVIPFNSDYKYHYWNGGQSVCDTLRELGRCGLISKYKSIYSN